ncbi:hypothetical protein ZOSMA_14G00440 [Zostera marina]|uniref:Protein LOW PSII ACCUMULATION 1, chloroplastic n=1 Tax=Zostera marina TaxID=29655 RepID=A0A0K9PW76_ZOSMR|nr:hypothetical protein ZOSMA_14G00440 [Zostera marina]
MAHFFSSPVTNSSPHQTLLILPRTPLLYRSYVPSLPFSSSSFRRLTCSASNKPSSSSPEISSTARIRSEVLNPFRSVRMFFYLAFISSAGLGGLIATARLLGALSSPSNSLLVPDILKGLGIDLGAVFIFAFLYSRDRGAQQAQIARLSREENLSKLKMRVDENKIITVNDLRGIARVVILAGPASYITESYKRSKPFSDALLERGVVVVPFANDGEMPTSTFLENENIDESTEIEERKKTRLWQLSPIIASDWSKWLDEQKKMANVSSDSPVYLSLRLDGRVRGSGVGYPPWNAFVAQLPPQKGLWLGLFDGMDGRVN